MAKMAMLHAELVLGVPRFARNRAKHGLEACAISFDCLPEFNIGTPDQVKTEVK